jgi:hypothetical protein
MKQFQQVNVIGFLAEVAFKEMVNGGFKHEGIVDGDISNTVNAEPTGLSATSEGLVHDVIGDEEEGLKL